MIFLAKDNGRSLEIVKNDLILKMTPEERHRTVSN